MLTTQDAKAYSVTGRSEGTTKTPWISSQADLSSVFSFAVWTMLVNCSSSASAAIFAMASSADRWFASPAFVFANRS